MDGVVVHYPNNEVFNPHPIDIKTNEVKGTFPSRRAAVAADNCADMIFKNVTFKTDCKGQAEGFCLTARETFQRTYMLLATAMPFKQMDRPIGSTVL